MSVTDLTGTTWVFNDILDLDSFGSIKNIDFISNGKNFVGIMRVSIGNHFTGTQRYLQFTGNPSQQPYNENTYWKVPEYKTIQITGGTDATNSELISCLEANATQVLPTEPNRLYIKCNGNNHPQVKIPTGQTNTKRLYAKIKAKNLINFIIDGVSYQAEEGMTWEAWVNSSYNTNGFYILHLVRFADDSPINKNPSYGDVKPSEIIISDGVYYKGSNSGSGA